MTSSTLPPTFGIIIIGDEILSGKRQDKHLAKFIELLSERGLSLSYADYVGDDPERITLTLQRAFEHKGVVFSCGGIGATPDDHTRQCAAKALGRELVLHPEAEALIRERTRDVALENGLPYEPDRPDNVHRLNMGRFPAGASIIPNPYNKIAGFTCQGRQGVVHFVPGFPVMAWPMMAWGARQRVCRPFPSGVAHRKIGHRHGGHGSHPHAFDGSHRGAVQRCQGVQLAKR